jgi:hypothetical protein
MTGPDADRFSIISQHAAAHDILPGTDELFRLKLRNPCAPTAFSAAAQTASIPEWHASLEIDTEEGQLSAELLGRPMDCTWRDTIYNRPHSRPPLQPGAG